MFTQLVQKQAARAILMNRGRIFLSTSAVKRGGYGDDHGGEYQRLPIKTEIGTREVVGYGMTGEESYIDHWAFPFPAIRFKEDTPDILKLKEKEKGDWKKLTLHEKKELYRSSFCQTLAEVKAPTGEWKAVIGLSLLAFSVAAWGFIWVVTYAYDELPYTLTDDKFLKAELKTMIDRRAGAVDGLASHYDYEKNQWKSMP